MFYQQRNYRSNRENQNAFQQGKYWNNPDHYPEKMRDRLGYQRKPKMRNIPEKIEDENVLTLALMLIRQIKENAKNDRLAKLEFGKLFRKHQDYIKKVILSI